MSKIFDLYRVNNNPFPNIVNRRDSVPVGETMLEKSDALDTVEFSGNKTEKFADVRAEMDENVPDRTSTIEEKEKAISYIDRMLKCDDITPEMKTYWENKKSVIEMEIQRIKNEKAQPGTEKVEDVWKEFSEFMDKYYDKLNDDLSIEDQYENRTTYYSTYKTFIQRLLNCSDITEDLKAEYQRMEIGADFDLMAWEQNYQNNKNRK